MSKYIIISPKVKEICDTLDSLGFKLIYSDCIDEFIDYERYHADMQCIVINNKLFVLENADSLINTLKKHSFEVNIANKVSNGKYPNNISLNALHIGTKILGKIEFLDDYIKSYAITNGLELINVNQGYTACSCCKISEKALITTDISIYNQLKNTEIDVLKITNDNIQLVGAKRGEVGFIGGASVKINRDTVMFFGDITAHRDFNDIDAFFKKNRTKYTYIKDKPLLDIGGAVLLNFSQK